MQRDLQTATSIAVFDQSIRKGLRPVLNTSNYVFITRSADDYIPKMRHREARLDKRNVTYVGIYTSVKLIVREVLEVFCGFYFYRRVEFFTSPDSVFDNFNDRRTLMDRHRGERFADVNMMDSNTIVTVDVL